MKGVFILVETLAGLEIYNIEIILKGQWSDCSNKSLKIRRFFTTLAKTYQCMNWVNVDESHNRDILSSVLIELMNTSQMNTIEIHEESLTKILRKLSIAI